MHDLTTDDFSLGKRLGPPSPSTAGRSCTSNADCGSDAPSCDFPYSVLTGPAPYNQPQKVCSRQRIGQSCSGYGACTSGFCSPSSKQCAVNYYGGVDCSAGSECDKQKIKPGDMRCLYEWDCAGYGRCGNSGDWRADGSGLSQRCLAAGGQACSDPGECQSKTCTNGICGQDWGYGWPAPSQESCTGNYTLETYFFTPAIELADGTRPRTTTSRTVGCKTRARTAVQIPSVNPGGVSICSTSDGSSVRLANEWALPCSTNYECLSGRCAYTKGSTAPVCMPQPAGAGVRPQQGVW